MNIFSYNDKEFDKKLDDILKDIDKDDLMNKLIECGLSINKKDNLQIK